jgi:Protein of unknown function (DUF3602)
MSPSSLYDLVEPHPQATTPYVHTARGGAGNVASASSTTNGQNASGPASRHPSLFNPRRSFFTSGRGGAGNLHHASERTIFSFDEELEREMRQTQDLAPICYVGRGGAGNKAFTNGSIRSVLSSDTDSVRSDLSTSTSGSESGGDALNRKIRKGWGKVVGIGHHM